MNGSFPSRKGEHADVEIVRRPGFGTGIHPKRMCSVAEIHGTVYIRNALQS